jgi:hypothetical protein
MPLLIIDAEPDNFGPMDIRNLSKDRKVGRVYRR